jgi:hypothetical protein
MGSDHPFTGVGFASCGDRQRRVRDTQALILHGPNVATNAAHHDHHQRVLAVYAASSSTMQVTIARGN